MLCYNLVVLLFKYVSCLNNVCIWIKYYYIDLMFHVFTKDPMEQYRNQKYFDVLIFYVVLSTHSVLLPICHVVLSTWSVVLPICHVICLIVLSSGLLVLLFFIPFLYQRTYVICNNLFYYMAMSQKDWKQTNSRIWLAKIDLDRGLDFPI